MSFYIDSDMPTYFLQARYFISHLLKELLPFRASYRQKKKAVKPSGKSSNSKNLEKLTQILYFQGSKIVSSKTRKDCSNQQLQKMIIQIHTSTLWNDNFPLIMILKLALKIRVCWSSEKIKVLSHKFRLQSQQHLILGTDKQVNLTQCKYQQDVNS